MRGDETAATVAAEGCVRLQSTALEHWNQPPVRLTEDRHRPGRCLTEGAGRRTRSDRLRSLSVRYDYYFVYLDLHLAVSSVLWHLTVVLLLFSLFFSFLSLPPTEHYMNSVWTKVDHCICIIWKVDCEISDCFFIFIFMKAVIELWLRGVRHLDLSRLPDNINAIFTSAPLCENNFGVQIQNLYRFFQKFKDSKKKKKVETIDSY